MAENQQKALEGEPEYIYIDFKTDRTWLNKAARIVYFVMHGFYVSFFFYFAPFASILISYAFVQV